MKPRSLALLLWLLAATAVNLSGQPVPAGDADREREVRTRYEAVLVRNPFQDRAFDAVYEGYAKFEGVDQWVTALKPRSEAGSGPEARSALVLLGRIYDRLFKTSEALAALEQAAAAGEDNPQFKLLLGSIYYKAGRDEPAATNLAAALEAITDLDQRASTCRLLGNLYLRQGKRAEAIAVWKRIAEQNPEEIFAQLELAEIYEDNRMWDEAITVYRGIVDRSEDDPYRRCRALRAIGNCQVQQEKPQEAIATYEQALGLAAPGNWLFEDLKLRLVGVYEEIGDLGGLARYLEARLAQNPADAEFRDLLAETCLRMARFDAAEAHYRELLERNPRQSTVYEKLINLYTRTEKRDQAIESFEKLIALFPTEPDYLRRLGEFQLQARQPDQAKATWRRLLKDGTTGERLALLAGWFEAYEFPDEAIATYEQALQQKPERDWVERLASLKFEKGDETEAVRLWLSIVAPPNTTTEDCAAVASILEAHQKLAEAESVRRRAIEKDPQNLEALLAHARLLVRLGKHDEAVAPFETLAGQDENEFLRNQGESGLVDAWRQLGVLEEKQKGLEAELNADPANPRKLGKYARVLERAGQQEKAIALYETRRDADPANVEYWCALAALYQESKLIDPAIAAYKELLTRDRNRARVYQKELLDLYLAMDLQSEAMAAAEALVSLAPADPELRLLLAQVYQMYSLPEKAYAEYRHVLRLEPNEPDYHRQYGSALEAERRFGEAQEAYRKMLDTSREDSTRLGAVANLARIYSLQGRLPELTTEFQRRVRNTPKKLAAYEELAAVYRESGQVNRTVEVLEEGVNQVDDKPEALKALIRAAHEAQDFQKVRTSYEQLLAVSGQPTAAEYERLGQIYAQLGEIELAKTTWTRIVSEAPKDPKAADRLASLLQREGWTEDALGFKAKAVELEPANYRRRFEYAQMLAEGEQPVEALKELRTILDLGESELRAEEQKRGEKSVPTVTRGPRGATGVSPYQFISGMGAYYGGSAYYGGGWRGTFAEFRPQILMLMASVAQQSIGEDAFVEEFSKRATAADAPVTARRDLLQVLTFFNRAEEAVKVATELLKSTPHDTELVQQAAVYYQSQGKTDEAIALLEGMPRQNPRERLLAAQGLIPLYFQGKQEIKGKALLDELLKENPRDAATSMAMGNLMQQLGKLDEARKLYQRAAEVDPQYRPNLLMQLAMLARQQQKLDEARGYLSELLTNDLSPRFLAYNPGRARRLFQPQPNNPMARARYGGGQVYNYGQQIFGNFDYYRANALTQLRQLDKSPEAATETVNRLGEEARRTLASASTQERRRGWETAKLVCLFHISERQTEQASNLLVSVRHDSRDNLEWFNAALFLAQGREDFDGMLALYDEVDRDFPGLSRDVARARTATLIAAKRPEEAARQIRLLSQRRLPPAEIVGLISQFAAVAGEKQKARELLEEQLAGVGRTPEALSQLAGLYAAENDFEKAIALGEEAWNRRSRGRQGQSYYYSGGIYPVRYYAGPTGDGTLGSLYQYYVGAGRSETLVARFEEQLRQQPGSVTAHEELAQLYVLSNQRPKALETYKQLAARRPHLHQVKRQIASLYTEMGDFNQATALYENLMKANPAMYQEFSWELRQLYQRMGKGKELNEMEENLVAKARDPYQVQELAQRFQQEGDLEKAAELYRKAIQMSPGQPYMKNQLAQTLVQLGRLDEAVEMYQEWLDSPQMRVQGYLDHSTLSMLVGLYRASGRLEQLKQRCADELAKNPGDRLSLALKLHIAVVEKRFDEATAGFIALQEGPQRDPNGLYQLMELVDITGDLDAALAVVEKSDLTQGYFDHQRVARLYMAKGDAAKAQDVITRWVESQLQINGPWVLREGLNLLVQFELWDAADAFVRKHRGQDLQGWEAQELDRQIAEAYIQGNRFTWVFDEILAKEAIKGRDLELIRSVGQQLDWNNQRERKLLFLERVIAADPKNRELAFDLCRAYGNEAPNLARKLGLLEKLVAEDPANAAYRESWAAAMIASGRTSEVLEALERWAAERPHESRYLMLSRQQQAAGHMRAARASLLKAREISDPSRHLDLDLEIAAFDAAFGNPEVRTAALRKAFEERKNAPSFHALLSQLIQTGSAPEAHRLYLENQEAGYLDQYQGQNEEVPNLCLNQSDFQAALDLNWRLSRYGEQWTRDQTMEQTKRRFHDRGKLTLLAADFERRLDGETNRNPGMLRRLADLWARAGSPERALGIYDRLLQTNRFDAEAVSGKIELLRNLQRADEAVSLRRTMTGVTDLQAEVQATFELIRLLYTVGREAEAVREAETFGAWAKGGAIREQLGSLYFDRRQYDRAAAAYETALRSSRSWNHENLLVNLGCSYAALGQETNALQTWDRLGIRRQNHYPRIAHWLQADSRHDLTARWCEKELATQSNRTDLVEWLAIAEVKRHRTNESLVVFETWLPSVTTGVQSDLQQRCATFLRVHALTAQARERLNTPQGAALLPPLLQAYVQTKDPIPAWEELVERTAAEPTLALLLGHALHYRGQTAPAAACYRAALTSTNAAERLQAAVALALAGHGQEAAPELAKRLETHPVDFLDNTNQLAALARTGEETLLAKLGAFVAENAIHETQSKYLNFMVDWYRDRTNEARATLPGLVNVPGLRVDQLAALITVSTALEATPERRTLLERLVAAGPGPWQRHEALTELAQVQASTRDFPAALATLHELYPIWGNWIAEEARQAVADAVTLESLDAFKAATLAEVRKHPAHDQDSNLLGLYKHVAQRLGQDVSAAQLASEAGVSPDETREAGDWDQFIEAWELAGPYDAATPENLIPPERAELALASEGAPSEPVNWQPTDPKAVLGIVRLGPAFKGRSSEMSAKAACARTHLNSATDRNVTLALGTDDWAKVWVNGQLVHTHGSGRSLAPNQDRVPIRLRAGDNVILLKIGNQTDAWSFCARIEATDAASPSLAGNPRSL